MFRFVHLADLHFGKEMKGGLIHLDEEQSKWIDGFMEDLDDIKPDAVVIAGDIFDVKNPDSKAMMLFERFLNELAERDIYVFVVPGNHDSAVQLSQRKDLLKDKKIFIAREASREIMHITTEGETPVTFWLLPYVMRRRIADIMGENDYESYDAAFKALIGAQQIDINGINVLVAHQNVIVSGDDKPEESGSESGFIGGVCEVMASNFDDFDYVALGHIHNGQKVGRETVRYAGCPMYYDFSEIGREKDLTVVTINDNKEIDIELREQFLPYYLKQFEGTFEKLMENAAAWVESVNAENAAFAAAGYPYVMKYYVKLLVRGDIPYGGPDDLKRAYDNKVVQIKPLRSKDAADIDEYEFEAADELSIDSMFAKLYQIQDSEGREMTQLQSDILAHILASQDEGGYVSSKNDVDPAEVDNIINYIAQALERSEAAEAAAENEDFKEAE